MSHTATTTGTDTYSAVDVENVFRRFRADILMIADSTGAITRQKAEDYAHDAEFLAARKFLTKIDVTLIVDGVEHQAAQYHVNENSGGIDSSRPGGVLWPRIPGARIRIILSYTSAYTPAQEESAKKQLKIGWVPTSASTQHLSLTSSGARDYTSNAFGLNRKDFR
jgi:hypothetical protein